MCITAAHATIRDRVDVAVLVRCCAEQFHYLANGHWCEGRYWTRRMPVDDRWVGIGCRGITYIPGLDREVGSHVHCRVMRWLRCNWQQLCRNGMGTETDTLSGWRTSHPDSRKTQPSHSSISKQTL